MSNPIRITRDLSPAESAVLVTLATRGPLTSEELAEIRQDATGTARALSTLRHSSAVQWAVAGGTVLWWAETTGSDGGAE